MIFFATLLFAITGCKKAVEIDPPVTSLVSTSVYTNNATAAAVLTGIYDRISQGSNFSGGTQSIALRAGLSADELKNFSSDISLTQFYSNSIPSNDLYGVPPLWNTLYQFIYSSNAAIEGLTSSSGVTNSVKQQLIGEAKFTRAFLYFYAVNLFGDVPLLTSSDYRVNAVAPRSPKAEVYQQIVSDLKDALPLLSDNYLSSNIANVTTERVRPTKWAAAALLARTYLYIGDWVNSEAQASSVINSTKFSLVTNLNSVFLQNSNEAIWQLQAVDPSYNTMDGKTFILTSSPATSSISPAGLSSNLLNAFETGDNRLGNWTGSYTSGGVTYYYPYKYKVKGGNPGTPVTEYLMMLRLGEQYLIRAEARAQQNNISGALSDLNAIRSRAGLPLSTVSDKATILTAVQHERQIELFAEWGHRWLDLKRTATVDLVMAPVTTQKGGTWNTNWQLYPIPQSEMLNNPNLVQNPGY